MLERLLRNLQKLETKKIVIKAEGNYPRGTPVQHVAHYQNDGTEKIKPAKFVEAAQRKAGHWKRSAHKAIAKYLDDAESALMDLGIEVAFDVNEAVNRIKTGRLKHSMTPEVE